MTSLRDYSAGLDPAIHAEVMAKLVLLSRQTATDRQAVLNLHAESRLPEGAWKDLVASLLSVDAEPAAIRTAMRSAMRKHILSGPPVSCPSTTIFGRAVTVLALARTLAANKRFPTVASAHSHIRSMRTRPVAFVKRIWCDCELGRFVMWSTFDPDGDAPFAKLPPSADTIRGLMGLQRAERGRPLLLLEYTLAPGDVVLFPSIAEAYAGDEWVYYFRPAPPEETRCGWTMVWDEFADRSPLPEVVHTPVLGGQLLSSLKEIP